MIEYFEAPDIQERVDEIVALLRFDHIDTGSVRCFRSRRSKAERTVARIHSLGRIWQMALGREVSYVIEVLSERFDRLPEREQERVLIHELLHIPSGFRGGLRPHGRFVEKKDVETWYRRLQQKRNEGG